MLLKAKKYLQNKKRVSLQQMANHLGCQRSAVEPMLDILVSHGKCYRTGASKAPSTIVKPVNSSCASSCGLGCKQKPSSPATSVDSLPGVYYQWLGT
jgi:hypothetical protein